MLDTRNTNSSARDNVTSAPPSPSRDDMWDSLLNRRTQHAKKMVELKQSGMFEPIAASMNRNMVSNDDVTMPMSESIGNDKDTIPFESSAARIIWKHGNAANALLHFEYIKSNHAEQVCYIR